MIKNKKINYKPNINIMSQNNILSALLHFHQLLSSVKILRSQGKDILNNICNYETEIQILERSPHYSEQPYLYSYAVGEIKNRMGHETFRFNTDYIQKSLRARSSMMKSEQVINNEKINQQWVSQGNKDFRLALFQIMQIMRNIVKAYGHQIELIVEKWSSIQESLLEGKGIGEEAKILMLHISFETYIDDSLLREWDQTITGLQGKRYK